jgi:small subunit ribosomal protein S9
MENTAKHTAIGRRKESVARVQLSPGKGDIRVNGRPIEKYFLRETDMIVVKQPLQITDSLSKYDVLANISGGGTTGQAGALKLGIARCLISADPALKDLLRKQGFLTRDPRATERKKYGLKGARRRFQWTKR